MSTLFTWRKRRSPRHRYQTRCHRDVHLRGVVYPVAQMDELTDDRPAGKLRRRNRHGRGHRRALLQTSIVSYEWIIVGWSSGH